MVLLLKKELIQLILTQNQEKNRCTLILSITTSGIFKGNYSEYMINQLNEVPLFKEGKTFFLNNSAWMTRDIMDIYINKIYK